MKLTFDTTPLIGPNTLDRLCVRAMTRPPDEIIEDRYLRRWHFVRVSTLSLYLRRGRPKLSVDDPPPSTRRSAAMAVSRAFGHWPTASGRIAMAFGAGVPVPVPSNA